MAGNVCDCVDLGCGEHRVGPAEISGQVEEGDDVDSDGGSRPVQCVSVHGEQGATARPRWNGIFLPTRLPGAPAHNMPQNGVEGKPTPPNRAPVTDTELPQWTRF